MSFDHDRFLKGTTGAVQEKVCEVSRKETQKASVFTLQTENSDEGAKLLSHQPGVSPSTVHLHLSSAAACNTFAESEVSCRTTAFPPVFVILSFLPTWAPCAEKQVPLRVC